jgi:hypothetical protein
LGARREIGLAPQNEKSVFRAPEIFPEDDMFEEIREVKANLGFKWVRSASGRTYLCPASQAEAVRGATDSELEATCLDESSNPQNN